MSDTELKPCMTLDEAIEHCKEKAKEQEYYSKFEKNSLMYKSCVKCAEEHKQLAEWLEELKNRRSDMERIVEQLEKERKPRYREDGSIIAANITVKIDRAIEIVQKVGTE